MKRIFYSFVLMTFGVLFITLDDASAAEPVYSKNATITQKDNVSGVFYTNDGKVTVEVNIKSISENTKNNTLQVILQRPFLGGYSNSHVVNYSTTGKKTFTYDFGAEGPYRIYLGLGGSTGFSTPVKIITETKIFD